MQLPDEFISYQYQSLLVPAVEEWTAAAELRSRHYLPPARLKELGPRLLQVRSQVAAERDLQQVPLELQPLESGFIDLPQKTLDDHRRKAEGSVLGRIQAQAAKLRELADRVIFLGVGGTYQAGQALFDALRSAYHNELSAESRMGVPRIYFAGHHVDNDAVHDLLEMLQATCVDPEIREERWAVVLISKSSTTLETTVAHRVFRREAREYYGSRSERLRQLFVTVTAANSKLRDLCRAEGAADTDVLTLPENVGDRFSVFTAAGLLPAAIMGLDVRALLLGAADMTRRFLEEPFERNPVLQHAGVNFLMTEEFGKPLRVLSVWSKKLEALGRWYEHLVAESLGKQGQGPTPLTLVGTRDLFSHGQQLFQGTRYRLVNNLVVKTPKSLPIAIGMADRNEDELNALCRKTLPDLTETARLTTDQACAALARPSADIIMPSVSEHTLGQLMQLLMLATVVEGRLMGINPYGHPALDDFERSRLALLKSG
jgi:glucose-6-phosphate isomerase